MDERDITGEARKDAFYRYNGIKAPAVPSTYDVESLARKQAMKQAEAEKPTLLDTGIAAWEKTNLEYALGKAIVRNSRYVLDGDEDFTIDEEMQADIDLNYNKKESKILSKASSVSDFVARKEEIEEERESSMVLAQSGLTGWIAQLGMGMLDPATWISGGLTSTAVNATRLAGIARVAATAGISGVENAAFAAAVGDSQSTNTDTVIAFGLGSGIGFTLSGMGNINKGTIKKAIKNNNPIAKAFRRDSENIVAKDIEAALPLDSTDAAKAFPDGDLRASKLKMHKYQEEIMDSLVSPKVQKNLERELDDLNAKVGKKSEVGKMKSKMQAEVKAMKDTLTASYVPKLKAATKKLKALEAKTKGIPKKGRFSHSFEIAEVKGEIKTIEADIKKVEDSIETASASDQAKAIKEVEDSMEDTPLNKLVQRRDAIAEKLDKAKTASIKHKEWNKLTEVERMSLVEPDGPKDLASSTFDSMAKVDNSVDSTEGSVGSMAYDNKTYTISNGDAKEIKKWITRGAELDKGKIGYLPTGKIPKAIYSTATRLTNSRLFAIRGIASAMLESPQRGALGKESASVNFTLNRRLIHSAQEGKLQDGFAMRLKDLKAQGEKIGKLEFGKLSEARSNFNKEVMLELQKPGSTTSKPVIHAAEGLRQQFKVGIDMMDDTGVKGVKRIKDETYVPVVLSPEHIIEGIAKYGEDDVAWVLRTAYESEVSIMPDTADIKAAIQIEKAKGTVLTMNSVLRNGKTVKEAIDELGVAFSKEFDYGLRGELKEELQNIKKYIESDLNVRDRFMTPRLRRFFEMDISTSIDSNSEKLKVIDFLDNDLDRLSESFTREASANAAMAKAGFKSRLEFYNTLNNIEKVERNSHAKAENFQATKAERDALSEEITMLREMEHRFYGEPIDSLSPTTRMNVHDLTRAVAIRDLVASGLSQIPEAAVLAIRRSWISLWNSMSLKELVYPQSVREGGKRFGKHRRADFAELDEVFGFPGEDHILFNKKFEMDSLDELAVGMKRKGLQRTLDVMSRVGPIASGMKHIQGALDKAALRSVSATIKKMAYSKGYKRKLNQVDLERAGWSRDFFEGEVLPWLRENRSQVDFNGKKLDTMNFSEMAKEKPKMFKQVQVGMQRIVQADIQRSYLGELPRFMNTTAGSVVTQHRSFVLGSFEKQLLHGFKKEPIVATATVGTGMVLAYLSNLGKVAYREGGKDDFDEKLEEAIDVTNPRTFMNALLNTGQLSSLGIFKDVLETVGAVNPMLNAMGVDKTSNDLGFRSLGSQSIPAVGFVRDAVNVPKSVFQAIDPDSEKGGKDVLKAMHRAIPMASAVGINQVLNYMEAE